MEEQHLAEQSEIAPPTLSFTGEGFVEREVIEQPVINGTKEQSHIMEESKEQTGCENLCSPAVYSPIMKQYRTRGPNRGLMVIFSYSTFLTRPDDRDVDSDCEMLKDLFNDGFRFKVIIHKNLDKTDTLKVMKEMSVEGYESLFIVVSSHGSQRIGRWDTEFDCNLGKIATYEVVHMFNNSNRPELAGVPKVFIFQMCRGSKKLSEMQAAASDSAMYTVDESVASAERCKRMFSDVLIAHSTVPGFESVRNLCDSSQGSLYMEALCHVFASLAHERHVLDLFRILDNKFKELCSSTITAVESWGFGDLYLHPGLVEVDG